MSSKAFVYWPCSVFLASPKRDGFTNGNNLCFDNFVSFRTNPATRVESWKLNFIEDIHSQHSQDALQKSRASSPWLSEGNRYYWCNVCNGENDDSNIFTLMITCRRVEFYGRGRLSVSESLFTPISDEGTAVLSKFQRPKKLQLWAQLILMALHGVWTYFYSLPQLWLMRSILVYESNFFITNIYYFVNFVTILRSPSPVAGDSPSLRPSSYLTREFSSRESSLLPRKEKVVITCLGMLYSPIIMQSVEGQACPDATQFLMAGTQVGN